MIHSDKGADPPDKEDLTRSTPSNPEDGLSQILRLVLQELNLFYSRDVSGLCLLYDLLHSPWLQALLKVYDCLQEFKGKKLLPATSQAQALSHEALLSAHDTVAQKDFEPLLPPLPDNIPEGEEAMRIVCLVKNQQPLGATIKCHEMTGDILVARVIHGGLAERSEDDMKIDEKCVEADKEEFVGHGQKFFIAGFRRSMRLCRRRSLLPTLCCPSSCPSAAGAPYEEVVRHQRCPSDKHRLIVLVDTTRSKKSYEVDGREYHYVSKETFESLMYSHRMLESGEYKGHFYGTSVDAVQAVLNEGKICVMDLEPQDEDLQEMEDLAQKMETQFGQFFDHVIVNDILQDACAQLVSAVQKAQEEPQWVPATWVSSETGS
ncbi:MAGUK p55 subfamily member 4 [Myotis davidii]|uniref:MAGUK p55 subfamily member 4 n=1 Tax=Myotis davidii TaxID=225400 RepID=L5MDP7_MYODS|nr:MAGUK p55 subfamily member 4 [Myotis davidii]